MYIGKIFDKSNAAFGITFGELNDAFVICRRNALIRGFLSTS